MGFPRDYIICMYIHKTEQQWRKLTNCSNTKTDGMSVTARLNLSREEVVSNVLSPLRAHNRVFQFDYIWWKIATKTRYGHQIVCTDNGMGELGNCRNTRNKYRRAPARLDLPVRARETIQFES